MNTNQALEMAEALTTDNEMSISTLGGYGDDVAIALFEHTKKLESALVYALKNLSKGSLSVVSAHVNQLVKTGNIDDLYKG